MRCAWCGGAITAVGCDCTAAVRRAARPHCACCGAARPRQARFCPQCGASYVAGTVPDASIERRQITFVFCDLVGSTALSDELDPEDYRQVMLSYRGAVGSCMSQFGGRVERYRGDGTLVYFGYPEAHEDDAERAVHAALKTVDAVRAISLAGVPRLSVRAGVATGLVVIAGTGESDEPAAMGDAPNIASRLQGHVEANSVIVDDATRRLVGDLFDFRDLGAVPLKGIAAPMRAWSVAGARAVASRFDARRNTKLSPMLGRDDEYRTLSQLWRQARGGHGQIALVTGDAGIGKSRLAAALLEETRSEPSGVYRYFCSPYRRGSPLHPCIQQLEHATGFTSSDTPEDKLAKLDAILSGASARDCALLAELLNLPPRDPGVLKSLSPPAKRRRTMQALASLLGRAATRQPALVVFEDVQWIDDTSRELMLIIAQLVPRMSVMLLVLTRPGGMADFNLGASVTRLFLGPLPASLSAALVRHVAADRPLPPETIRSIVLRTDGIPLFLEEVTRATVEGAARHDASVGSLEGKPLPMLLRASLQSRLNRLGAAREVLEAAAVIGRDFSLPLLERVVQSGKDLGPALDQLVEFGIVLRRASPDVAYTFKHALIRDAAYEIIGRDSRRALHEKIAGALEGHLAEAVANQPEILAWHYTEARIVDKAVVHWLAAGRSALRRSAMVEALEHLNRGIVLVSTTERSPWRLQNELALTICIGMAQIATQGYAVVSTGETFARARALCELLGDPPPLLAVLHGLWTHALLRADLISAQRQAEQILRRGREKDDPLWRLMGYRFSGVTCHPLGLFGDAIRELETGIEQYDPAQQGLYASITVDDPRVVMLTYMSWSQMCAGRLAEAIRNSDEAVSQGRRMGHVYTLAHALTGASFVALTLISPQAGLQRLDELAAALADSGIAYYHAVETIFRGWCLAASGVYPEALEALTTGMAAYRATESVLYLSGFLRMSAEALGWAGETETALGLLEESFAITQATDQRWDEAELHRVHGTLLRARGNETAARQAFQRACAVAVGQGAKLWELRARCSLIEQGAGERDVMADEARQLRLLVASFDDALDLPDLRRARAILESRMGCARHIADM